MVASSRAASARCFPAGPGEVHVWSCLSGRAWDTGLDLALLDDEERARAERYHFDRDRVRFVHRHGFTRRVLTRYLDMDPTALRFRISAYGRPALDPASSLTFNISQAGDLTVVAVAWEREVGVDAEQLRPVDGILDLAGDVLAPTELAELRALSPAHRTKRFLTLWTRKESVVKAIGQGLSMPLPAFTVLYDEGERYGIPRDASGTLPYAFAPVPVPPGHVATVTLAGSEIAVHHMDDPEVGRC